MPNLSTIDYDRPIENLIAGLNDTGHITHSRWKKTCVTFHHNGGRLSHQGVLTVWKTRPASAHFDIDANGDAAQYANAFEYAWSTGNTLGNQRSISIEMCNKTLSPTWDVAEVTWKSAARLAAWLFANIIGEAPAASNVLFHHDWLATACAGPYMDNVRSDLLAEVQAQYRIFKGVDPHPVNPPTSSPVAPKAEPYVVGPVMTKAWQKFERTPRDGVISGQDTGRKGCFDVSLWPSIQWQATGRATGSQLVKAAQKRLGLHPDGIVGPATAKAIQKWVGVTPDGVLGPKSTAALAAKIGVK